MRLHLVTSLLRCLTIIAFFIALQSKTLFNVHESPWNDKVLLPISTEILVVSRPQSTELDIFSPLLYTQFILLFMVHWIIRFSHFVKTVVNHTASHLAIRNQCCLIPYHWKSIYCHSKWLEKIYSEPPAFKAALRSTTKQHDTHRAAILMPFYSKFYWHRHVTRLTPGCVESTFIWTVPIEHTLLWNYNINVNKEMF